ncbi:MAG: trypsin-like serine protease [Bdellovibrio sp.]|nr:trypsin-like serine protease [Bdellovibrio sp.]
MRSQSLFYLALFLIAIPWTVKSDCSNLPEVLRQKDVNGALAPSIQAVEQLKTAKPRLVNLREISWPASGLRPPWQRTILRELKSVFQVFKLAERTEDITPEALPVGHADNPYPLALIPLCSGSYHGHGMAITASHCLRSKRTPVEELHIFRFYQYKIQDQHLVVDYYRDYKIVLGSVERTGDLAQVKLAPTPGALIHPVTTHSTQTRPNEYTAIGFPSHLVASPFVSLDCRLMNDSCGVNEICFEQCPTLGGMSGGPVARRNRASRGYQEQWGIVSESSNDGTLRSPTFTSSN